jgi:hypothetical protein
MGVVILLLIPLMPFTEQFARAVTPESAWTLFSAVILVAVIIYMLKFSMSYPDRVTGKTG